MPSQPLVREDRETSAGLRDERYTTRSTTELYKLFIEVIGIFDRCRQKNWDGEEARPVSLGAYNNAQRLIRSMPDDVPLPSVFPDTDGYIEFEWQSGKRSFSIMVGHKPLLLWAGYFGPDQRRSGRDPFQGRFPSDLITEIHKVYG